MSNTFLYRMPAGIAGVVNRAETATIEPGIGNATYPFLAYGTLTKLVSGLYLPIATGDTVSGLTLGGFLVRPYPIQEPMGTTAAQELIGYGVPPAGTVCNIMKRGYMSVLVTAGGSIALANIVKGTAVYVCKTTSGGRIAGDLEAGTQSGNEVITGAYFMGAADASGFCEIAYNI